MTDDPDPVINLPQVTWAGLGLGLAAIAAGGGEAGAGILAAGQQAAMGKFLAYSRNQEATTDQAGRLFLSSTTSKILTALPIPLVMVPRDYQPGRNGSTALPWTGALPAVGRD